MSDFDFMEVTYTTEQIDKMLIELKALKEKKDEISDMLKEVNFTFESVQSKLIEAMQECGKTRWEVKGLAKISISERLFPKLDKNPEQMKKFLDWCMAKGEDFYFTHISMHSQTLARVVKEEFEEKGEAVIPGVDASFRKKILSMRKA